MILADKIIELRKKNGWSQEELAERLNVTRQSVSKWESAQSTPDLDKILKLAEVFDVTTDYLLKNEGYEAKDDNISYDTEVTQKQKIKPRKVSFGEAEEFLNMREEITPKLSFGISLFVLSPVCLILLAGAGEYGLIRMNEDKTAMLGVAILLMIVAIGVTKCIIAGIKASKFEYLEKEPIELEAGLEEKIAALKEAYRPIMGQRIAIGVAICILAVVPIFIVGFILGEDDGYHFVAAVAVLLVIVSVAVNIFVRVGMKWDSLETLLEQGDFTRADKDERLQALATVYWLAVTGIYLGYSFITMNWGLSWIIWPVAGIGYAIIDTIYKAVKK